MQLFLFLLPQQDIVLEVLDVSIYISALPLSCIKVNVLKDFALPVFQELQRRFPVLPDISKEHRVVEQGPQEHDYICFF